MGKKSERLVADAVYALNMLTIHLDQEFDLSAQSRAKLALLSRCTLFLIDVQTRILKGADLEDALEKADSG